MRSSSAIKSEIQRITAEKTSLESLEGIFSKISSYIGEVSSTFIDAGGLIEDSGSIEGKPIDNGKTKEQGHNFNRISSQISDLMSELASTITNLKNKLLALNDELLAALAAEEAARIAAEANSNSVQTYTPSAGKQYTHTYDRETGTHRLGNLRW